MTIGMHKSGDIEGFVDMAKIASVYHLWLSIGKFNVFLIM